MKRQKKFVIAVICGIGLLLILMAVKGISRYHFRNSATKWSEKSFDRSNLLNPADLKLIKTDILFIDLNSTHELQAENITKMKITPDEILMKKNFKVIYEHNGVKVIASGDMALSARLWMLLSQMGIRELYILDESVT
jgi:hypothetical protein